MTAPAPTVTNELKNLLRAVKLGRCVDTLPERLVLAQAEEPVLARTPRTAPR